MIKRFYRSLTGKFTFLVLRDADKSVKQFRISKLILIGVPMLLIISLITLSISISWLTSYRSELTKQIAELEAVLLDKNIHLQQKELNIQNLQQEILNLSIQTQNMQARIDEISQLEEQLQQLISTFSEKTKTASVQTVEESQSLHETMQIIETFSANETNPIQIAERTKNDLDSMAIELASLNIKITQAMNEAENIANKFITTPSMWPTDSTRITSNFGYRKDPITRKRTFHSGIDIGADRGDPVYAAGAGKVVETGYNRNEGYYIVINHGGGFKTTYKHLSKIIVKKNQEVYRGDTIGKVGNSGRSTGPHLHFEVIKGGKEVDPLLYVSTK